MPEQHFQTPGPVTLEVRVASGEIRVSTGEEQESRVAIDGAPRLVETIRVELVGNRLEIHQRHRPWSGLFTRLDEALDIRVTVPHGSSAAILTAAASAALDGTFSGLRMKSASGGLTAIGGVDGDASVETVSGDVALPRIAGSLIARSVSGDVVADSVDGSVQAKSVSGNVRVASLREGTTKVQSVSGEVDLGIAPGTRIDLDAASASGQLSSEIPLSDIPEDSAGPTVVIRGRTVSGGFRVFRAA